MRQSDIANSRIAHRSPATIFRLTQRRIPIVQCGGALLLC
jgi:hypothetical protein